MSNPAKPVSLLTSPTGVPLRLLRARSTDKLSVQQRQVDTTKIPHSDTRQYAHTQARQVRPRNAVHHSFFSALNNLACVNN